MVLPRRAADSARTMLKVEDYSKEELERKKEEAERKARRGEIDPVHEYTFTLISKVNDNFSMS